MRQSISYKKVLAIKNFKRNYIGGSSNLQSFVGQSFTRQFCSIDICRLTQKMSALYSGFFFIDIDKRCPRCQEVHAYNKRFPVTFAQDLIDFGSKTQQEDEAV